mgnify:CR=1 FL=1
MNTIAASHIYNEIQKINNQNNILPGVSNYFNFGRGSNFSSALDNRTFGTNSNYGIDYNSRGLLTGFKPYEFLNKDFIKNAKQVLLQLEQESNEILSNG